MCTGRPAWADAHRAGGIVKGQGLARQTQGPGSKVYIGVTDEGETSPTLRNLGQLSAPCNIIPLGSCTLQALEALDRGETAIQQEANLHQIVLELR
jgi:hypothetical protein